MECCAPVPITVRICSSTCAKSVCSCARVAILYATMCERWRQGEDSNERLNYKNSVGAADLASTARPGGCYRLFASKLFAALADMVSNQNRASQAGRFACVLMGSTEGARGSLEWYGFH